MKQVAKCCQNRFNFHNIPFVAGTATTPSHNLGLNIQQVLSIIKMRQPITGTSAGGIIKRHFSGISHRPCVGPMTYASRQKLYSHSVIHENIPELPEKDEAVLDKGFIPDGERKSRYGSQYLNTRPMTAIPHCCEGNREMPDDAWTVDQDNSENKETRSNLRCTCFPTRQCVNYQKILNQFLESGEKLSFLRANHPVSQISYRPHSLRQHFSTMSRTQHENKMEHIPSGQSLNEKHIAEMSTMRDLQNQSDETKRCNKAPDFYVDIQGRATSLKEVLTNLHDDFSRLNSKYDELQAGVTQDTVDETEAMKQLEVMEMELQAKEEEITVVMALYKEVMTLKEQVKALKERASLANLSNRPAQRMKPRIISREPTAAIRLTKLLRTIQQFQDRLKNN